MPPDTARRWDPADGPLTEASVRARHQPAGHFRVSTRSCPAGTAFAGSMRACICYVLAGACRFTFGEAVDLREGDVADLPGGEFQYETLGPAAASSGRSCIDRAA